MSALSSHLNDELISALREELARGAFPQIDFKLAMEFILSDGILPRSHLPVKSFLMLEDWIKAFKGKKDITYSTTSLKNQTGEILEKVIQGHTIKLSKHGRIIAEIRPIS